MSAFGTSSSAICGDYFGDEFGVPLPFPASKTSSNNVTEEVSNKKDGRNNSPIASANKEPHVAPAFAPFLDGLHCFETLVL